MSVSTMTILQKMGDEVVKAKESGANADKCMPHVANVKLLCELLLDEGEDEQHTLMPHQTITPEEMKQMLGQSDKGETKSQSIPRHSVDHDQANGNSIFDF